MYPSGPLIGLPPANALDYDTKSHRCNTNKAQAHEPSGAEPPGMFGFRDLCIEQTKRQVKDPEFAQK